MNKIKLAFISPTKWITTLGSQGDFQLGLAHLLDRHQATIMKEPYLIRANK